MTRLLAVITPHGFGHAAQLAPVLNALGARLPGLSLTVATTLSQDFLRERVQCDFEYVGRASDFGLVMHSALEIDLEASAQRYRALHDDWQVRVEDEMRFIDAHRPDLVIADVPYLTLAAAQRLGVPAYALCSLNWADIYRHYFGDRPEAGGILAQMEAAYASARAFFRPEPSMPMHFLPNRVAAGPLARQGRNRRGELAARLGVPTHHALVLIAPGGVETRFPVERWPSAQGVHWLLAGNRAVDHPDTSPLSATGMAFTDLLASCDAVLGKCGYGTVTECVVNGTPLIHIPRPDWPEEPSLRDWLEAHSAAVPVDAARVRDGDLNGVVERARALNVIRRAPIGGEQLAARIASDIDNEDNKS